MTSIIYHAWRAKSGSKIPRKVHEGRGKEMQSQERRETLIGFVTEVALVSISTSVMANSPV